MQSGAVVVIDRQGEEKHAWIPGEQATLCGLETAESRRGYERFPPATGPSCLNCIGIAWNRFGRLTWP
jgi:hypothetical protein